MHVRPDRVQLPQHPVVERRSINVSERAILRSACATGRRPERARPESVRSGLTDFLTVLVAEQSVFTSQDTLAQTERDVALELVALYKAVGGGWEATAR